MPRERGGTGNEAVYDMDLDLQIQKPLRELVYQELKHKILTGEIAAQTRLMEISLAAKMNVSRTPIREAIRALAEEGLVTIEPRHGAYVSEISIKDMLDVFEVREDLEGLAASLAALRASAEEKEQLVALAKRYELAVENESKEEMVELDQEVHEQIVRCTGNQTLAQLIDTVQDLSLRFRYLYYDDFTHYRQMPEEHKEIIQAIVDGEAKRARDAADHHVRTLKEFVFEMEKKMRDREAEDS